MTNETYIFYFAFVCLWYIRIIIKFAGTYDLFVYYDNIDGIHSSKTICDEVNKSCTRFG